MIDCDVLKGRVIQSCTLYEDGRDGPEISIDFEDGTTFTVALVSRQTLNGKLTQNDGGEPFLLKQYEALVSSR